MFFIFYLSLFMVRGIVQESAMKFADNACKTNAPLICSNQEGIQIFR